jgi:hypothetical protein
MYRAEGVWRALGCPRDPSPHSIRIRALQAPMIMVYERGSAGVHRAGRCAPCPFYQCHLSAEMYCFIQGLHTGQVDARLTLFSVN